VSKVPPKYATTGDYGPPPAPPTHTYLYKYIYIYVHIHLHQEHNVGNNPEQISYFFKVSD